MLGLAASRRIAVLLAISVVAALAGVAIGCVSAEEADDGGDTAPEATEQPTEEATLTPIPMSPTPAAPTPPPTEAATPEREVTATSTPAAPTPSACPVPVRWGPGEVTPLPESELGWPPVEGSVSVGRVTLHLPAGREFIVAPFVVQPDGPNARPFLFIYDVQTGSVLHVTPEGCELERFVQDLAVDPVFDEIVATFEIGPP